MGTGKEMGIPLCSLAEINPKPMPFSRIPELSNFAAKARSITGFAALNVHTRPLYVQQTASTLDMVEIWPTIPNTALMRWDGDGYGDGDGDGDGDTVPVVLPVSRDRTLSFKSRWN